MGVFVVLPLVLPLTAWPMSRLAERRLHPRTATVLLTAVGAILAVCSTLCLALLGVVGTAQLPGNPLPDGWAAPKVRAAVPYDENVGFAAIGVLALVATACGHTLWRHYRVRKGAWRALGGLPAEAGPGTSARRGLRDHRYGHGAARAARATRTARTDRAARRGAVRVRPAGQGGLRARRRLGRHVGRARSGGRWSPTSGPTWPGGTTAICWPRG